MDPNEYLRMLVAAVNDGEWNEAVACGQDLAEWLAGGGSAPKVNADEVIALGMKVLHEAPHETHGRRELARLLVNLAVDAFTGGES